MSLAVFACRLPAYAFSVQPSRPSVVAQFGQQVEQRATRSNRTFRAFPYAWQGLTDAEYAALDEFFVARGGIAGSFLWRDPSPDSALPWHREGISLGSSVNGTTVYSLPTGVSEYAGDYPLNDVHLVVRKAGTIVTATAQTDDRTITLAANPGTGSALTADYWFYRRVRLDQWAPFARADHGLWAGALTFREVVQ